jgi:D-glycerate 3-kinase
MRRMTERELHRFIAHFERLTRWILLDEPANVIVHLDSRRVPIICQVRNSN